MILSGEKIIQIILLFAFPTHYIIKQIQLSSVQFSRSVMFNSLRPHELQHTRPPCLSPKQISLLLNVYSFLGSLGTICFVFSFLCTHRPLYCPSPPFLLLLVTTNLCSISVSLLLFGFIHKFVVFFRFHI